MATIKESAQEKKWQSEDDARTLMRAMEVNNDPKRHSAAMAEIEKQRKAADDAIELMNPRALIKKGLSKK